MSYHTKINVLVESLKLLEGRIESMIADPNHDKTTMTEALQQRVTLNYEISRLRKLQWEEDHERINLDDDR